MIELNNISVTFNPGTPVENHVLKDLNLSINKGDFITIIGGNGAGNGAGGNRYDEGYADGVAWLSGTGKFANSNNSTAGEKADETGGNDTAAGNPQNTGNSAGGTDADADSPCAK